MLMLNIDTKVKMCEDQQGEGNSATAHRCVFVITNLIISFNINIHNQNSFIIFLHPFVHCSWSPFYHTQNFFASFFKVSFLTLTMLYFKLFKASFCPASLVVGNKNYSELIGENRD